MPSESPRIADLRRRVEADPASIAFAQLAEEYRRAGNYQAAEQCCRTGLARHPGYLSARVTLGRSLIELGKLEESEAELQFVLKTAPDNLAALRGMAEIHQRRGNLELALEFFRRALPLARHDRELEETVSQINRELGGAASRPATPGLSLAQAESEILSAASRLAASPIAPAGTPGASGDKPGASAFAPAASPGASEGKPPAPVHPSPTARSSQLRVGEASRTEPSAVAPAETLGASAGKPEFAPIDFDELLRSLSGEGPTPPIVDAIFAEPPPAAIRPEPVLPELPVETAPDDPFAALEQGLRDFDTPAYSITELEVSPDATDGESTSLPDTQPPVPATPKWLDDKGHEGGPATPKWPEAEDRASVTPLWPEAEEGAPASPKWLDDRSHEGGSTTPMWPETAEGAPASLTWLDDKSHEGGSPTPMWPEAQEVGPVAPTWPDAQDVESVTSTWPDAQEIGSVTPTWPEAYEGGPATSPAIDAAAAVDGETSPAVSPSEQAILDELEAWLASIKR